MAKDLPYFKFFCSEWNDGDITLEDYKIQGLFINICSYYWSNECIVMTTKLKKKFKQETQTIDYLINEGFIKINNDFIIINFLDEQLNERKDLCNTNRINALKGWEKRKESERNANALNSQCENDAIKKRKEKIIEDKKRKDNKIPSFLDFKNYAIEKANKLNKTLDFSKLELKYDSWVENDWKDGNNLPIKNWKSKLLNSLPYLWSDNKKQIKPTKRIVH